MSETGVGRPPIWDAPQVIEYVADRMAEGVQKYALKAEVEAIAEKRIDSSCYEKVRRKARILIRKRADKSLAEFQDDAIQTLRSIICDEDTKATDKILAVKELNSLLGIGGQFKREVSEEEKAEKVRQFIKAADDNIENQNESGS